MSDHLPITVTTQEFQTIMGLRIRDFRKKSGMTQATLADQVNISRAAVANIEIGRQRTSVVLLARLAECLDVQIDEIIPSSREVEVFAKNRRELAAPVSPSPKLAQELAKHNISMNRPGSIKQALAKIAPSAKKETTT